MQNNEYQPGQDVPEFEEGAQPGQAAEYQNRVTYEAAPQYQPEEVQEDEYYEDDEEYEDDAGRRAGKGCLILFLAVLLIIAIAAGIAFSWYKKEIGGSHAGTSDAQIIDVPSGASGRTIGSRLESAGIIGNSTVFRVYTKYLYDGDTSFKEGSFLVEPGMSYDELLKILTSAPNYTREIQITLGEGVTIMSIASKLEEYGLCTMEEFFTVADDLERFRDIPFIAKYLEDIDEPVFHYSEGLVFPDTYMMDPNATVEQTVRRLYEQMDSKFTQQVYDRLEELELSVREFLVLTSIIQAEAGNVDQQPYVSDVIWNRLGSGWTQRTLGVDVTLKYVRQFMQWDSEYYWTVNRNDILYAEAREYVGDALFYAYVTEDTDGNSRKGLPTGPICSVTQTAMNAALNPEPYEGKTNYYFLTTELGNYYYAETLAQHEANVVKMYEENAQAAEQAEVAG